MNGKNLMEEGDPKHAPNAEVRIFTDLQRTEGMLDLEEVRRGSLN